MEWLMQGVDFFLHLDHHLNTIIERYGAWTYLLIFMIIFLETGVVFTPFLPGDSLLFALGAFAATDILELKWLLLLLTAAAILGDSLNYFIGTILAPKIFRKQHIRFLKQEHLERTQKFYDKYGVQTIIIARFIPIIRTFAPFLAGVGKMKYSKFIFYNIIGGVLWVFLFVLAGYFFGNLPVVKDNFSIVILVIIIFSLVPLLLEFLKHRSETLKTKHILKNSPL